MENNGKLAFLAGGRRLLQEKLEKPLVPSDPNNYVELLSSASHTILWIQDEEDQECCVCMMKTSENGGDRIWVKTSCEHYMHDVCAFRCGNSGNGLCPLCRTPLAVEGQQPFNNFRDDLPEPDEQDMFVEDDDATTLPPPSLATTEDMPDETAWNEWNRVDDEVADPSYFP